MTRLPASEFGLHLRLWSRLRPFWPYLGALFLLSLLAAPLALMTPLPVKIVIDSVLGSQPLPRFLEVLLPDPAR
jgi:ATP-binding cassette subfamily B protein